MSGQRYKFVKKEQSKGGRDATIMAGIAAALFLVSIAIAYFMEGQAGVFVGGFSLVAALISVYGFIVGMRSFGEKDVSYLLTVVGSIGCGIIMVAYLTLFLAGIR